MELLLERAPADVAIELTGRDYLSYSAVNTYQACPLRYYFRYVLGLPEAFVSASLVFGSAIHAGIEAHFREQLQGNGSPPFRLLQEVYHAKWLEYEGRTIRFGKGEDRNSLDALADRMLNAFQRSDVARLDQTSTILGIEEEFRGELIPGCPPILARVDLLVDTAEALVLTDFKTSRSRWSEDHAEEASGQLLVYHDLATPLALGKQLRLEFVVLTKTKEPAICRHSIPFERRQIERAQKMAERVWMSIQAGLFYPNPSPLNCGTCPFRGPCRDWPD